jgi:hypothetical protein
MLPEKELVHVLAVYVLEILRWRVPLTRVNPWEIITDNLSKAGWSWGCVSAIDSRGQRFGELDGRQFVRALSREQLGDVSEQKRTHVCLCAGPTS